MNGPARAHSGVVGSAGRSFESRIAEAGADGAGGEQEGIVERDLALAGGFFERGVGEASALDHGHAVALAGHEHLDGVVAEAGGQFAVGGDGRAAALGVA